MLWYILLGDILDMLFVGCIGIVWMDGDYYFIVNY